MTGRPVVSARPARPVDAVVRRLRRALVRRVLVALVQAHDDPHFECLTETRDQACDGLNERGVGHVCVCSCRRCNLVVHGVTDDEVCVCRGCDARSCGLHVTTRNALRGEESS